MAFELNSYIKRQTKGKTDYMALKLDVSKAYDRIELMFLKKVLL